MKRLFHSGFLSKMYNLPLKILWLGWVVNVLAMGANASEPTTLNALQQQHVLNRLSYGATQAELAKLQRTGFDNYLEEQLHANQPYTPSLTQQLANNSLPTMQQLASQYIAIDTAFKQAQLVSVPAVISTPVPMTNMATLPTSNTPSVFTAKQLHDQQRQQLFKQVDTAARNRRILLAAYDPNQLLEVMTDFWYYHFNIYNNKSDMTHLLYADFEQTAIRSNALGKFADLLKATAHHPAMLDYLDNRLSSVPYLDPKHPTIAAKGGINENYAREIMELHTLGVKGGYTQADVTSLAKILTGWGSNLTAITKDKSFVYTAKLHDSSAKTWLNHPIAAGQQQEEGEQIGRA